MRAEAPPHQNVHASTPHDSARLHVSGAATYIDDIPEPAGLLHMALGLSPIARGRLVALDLAPVLASEGVVRVLTAADVPGRNDTSPALFDEPMLCGRRDFLSRTNPFCRSRHLAPGGAGCGTPRCHHHQP